MLVYLISDMLVCLISYIFTLYLLSHVPNSQLTQEYFADFMGEFVEPKDVFLAFTVDQGGNAVNACEGLGVEVIKCNCHRVNSAVMWSLGIAGYAARCKNKAMGELMKKLACVGVWSHSAVNNDKLKELQKHHTNICIIQTSNYKSPRVVSPDELVDRVVAGGGLPRGLRAHQAKRHEVICNSKLELCKYPCGARSA